MSEQKGAVQVYQPERRELSAFSSLESFESAQRMARALAESELVPASYKGKIANCIVALEVAQRCQASPLMVMQNLNMIHGRPSWSSSYIIAAINSCGRFAPLRFKLAGEGDARSCIAWTTDKQGEILESPPVSIQMAKAEGWYSRKDRNGNETSKWPTMPELMLRYRSAAFFGRLYAPEILMGMRTDDEERDIIELNPADYKVVEPAQAVDQINKRIRAKKAEPKPAETPVTQAAADAPAAEASVDAAGDSHF